MAVSKKKKYKPKKKKTNQLNDVTLSNQEVNLMNLKIFSLPKDELVNTYLSYRDYHLNPFNKEIDLKMNFISITLKTAFKHPEPYKDLFGYMRDEKEEPNCYLSLLKYMYDDKIALIGEVNHFNKDPRKTNLDPLKSLVYLADLLDLTLAFPAYTQKDPQEKMFKSLGFEDSLLKADEGQKILLRKPKKVD